MEFPDWMEWNEWTQSDRTYWYFYQPGKWVYIISFYNYKHQVSLLSIYPAMDVTHRHRNRDKNDQIQNDISQRQVVKLITVFFQILLSNESLFIQRQNRSTPQIHHILSKLKLLSSSSCSLWQAKIFQRKIVNFPENFRNLTAYTKFLHFPVFFKTKKTISVMQ